MATTTDPTSFARHATLDVLLLPVQPIKRTTYSSHCAQIRQYSRIAVRDVPSDNRGDRAALSSSPRAKGHVLLNFLDSHSRSTTYLEDFEPARRLFGIIGIVDCREWDDLNEANAEFQQMLRRHPRVFATRCYAFAPKEGHKDEVDGIVTIPSVGEAGFYISTLLADLASSILYELSNMLASLETRQSVSTPREAFHSTPLEYLQPRSWTPVSSTYSFPPSKSTPELASIKTTDIPRTGSPVSIASPSSNLSPADATATGSLRASTSEAYTPAATDKTSKRRMQGRLAKLKGDLHVLAGRWPDALLLYNEAVATARAVIDPVWEAAALERIMLTTAVLAWLPNAADSPQMAISTPKVDLTTLANRPASQDSAAQAIANARDLPDKSATVIALYSRLVPPQTASASLDALPPVLYIEACLRHARLLMALAVHNGMSSATLSSLIDDHAWPLRLPPSAPRPSVAEALSSAYHPSLSFLPVPDRLFYLNTLAAAFASLGYERKRAAIVREAAAVASEAISRFRREAQIRQEALSIVASSPEVEGNEVIVALLEQAADAYGVAVLQKRRDDKRQSIIGGAKAIEAKAEVGVEEDAFGWPDLQVAMLKDAISMTDMLPDYASTLRFTISALRQVSPYMPPLDQLHLSQSIPPILHHAARRGSTFALDYWGPLELLVSIEAVPLEAEQLPIDTSRGLSEGKVAAAGPFIYAPGQGKSSAATKVDLVQGNTAHFLVTLQNPFMFDLELQSIELSTNGTSFTPHQLPCSVPPSSFHVVRLSGTPTETGTLTVRGCKVRLANAGVQEFILPVHDDAEAKKRQHRDSLRVDLDRTKSSGLSIWRSRKRRRELDAKEEEARFLECRVVKELPLLKVKTTSLIHGAMMLYEGERSSIQIVLENVSNKSVDYLELGFGDTWTTAVRAELRSDDLPVGEAYELATALRDRPVFAWKKPGGLRIEPGNQVVLIIECFGRVGCTAGEIAVKYGCVEAEEEKQLGRQLSVPVALTVHRALEATTMSISRRNHVRPAHREANDERGLERIEADAHALLAVDVRNVYGQPFEVRIESQSEEEATKAIQRVEPGAMATLLLRVDQFTLPTSETSEPIPTPAGKQFVVDKSVRTANEERAARELFWYREAFLDSLMATWHEIGTLRHGVISLRNLRLTRPMLDVLKPPLLTICLEAPETTAGQVLVDEHFVIRAKIEHEAAEPLDLLVYFDVLQHVSRDRDVGCPILFEGTPRRALSLVSPSITATCDIRALCLSVGVFEVGCTIEAGGELYTSVAPLMVYVTDI